MRADLLLTGVFGNDWILDNIGIWSIFQFFYKRWTNIRIYYVSEWEGEKHIPAWSYIQTFDEPQSRLLTLRLNAGSSPSLRIGGHVYKCSYVKEGPCLQHPTVKHQRTLCLTNHQRTTWLGLSTVAHSAWQTASTEEGLSRGTTLREDQSSAPSQGSHRGFYLQWQTQRGAQRGFDPKLPNRHKKTQPAAVEGSDWPYLHNWHHLNCEANTTSLIQ